MLPTTHTHPLRETALSITPLPGNILTLNHGKSELKTRPLRGNLCDAAGSEQSRARNCTESRFKTVKRTDRQTDGNEPWRGTGKTERVCRALRPGEASPAAVRARSKRRVGFRNDQRGTGGRNEWVAHVFRAERSERQRGRGARPAGPSPPRPCPQRAPRRPGEAWRLPGHLPPGPCRAVPPAAACLAPRSGVSCSI